MQAAAAALHALGLRRPTSAACGAAGAGAWAAVARLRPARTARPQLRVQLSPVVFVQLRSSIAARPPRRGPGWEALPSLSAPGTGGWGPRLLLLRAREKRGDRRDPPPCRAGEARREARESRELGDRAPLLFPACGALGRRGDFGGTDLRGGVRGMGAGNWGQCWRGLGWSAERARAGGRRGAASPRAPGVAGAPQTCHPARSPPQARVPGRVLCPMVLVLSFGARVRLGPAYGGLDGVNHSPPHTLTMRGMWTSAAPLIQALK